MILEAHKWNTDRKYINQIAPRGFHNLGNTCFLNATLQCLTYLPTLCQTLITISESKARNGQNGGKKKIPQGQKITSSLCSLFQQAHGLNNNSSKVGGPFAPKKIVGHLPNIGSCGSRNGYKFRLGRQEDAHEFLVHLLDAINDGELRAAGINQNISGWRDRLPGSRLDETTFVHRTFGGYFRSQVRCRRCNYRSNTYDPFLDLSLEVSKKSSTSVLKALSEFTRKETLDAANQWKCSGCKKYVCATKQLTVFRPPLTLCIQLKRFAFDSFGFGQKSSKYQHGYGGGGYGGGSKITKPIEFPGTLQLPLSDNRSCQYTLTGIVIHVGGSSQSGHYTAYVKKPGKNGTSQWYHMDDSEVQPVSERTVLKQRDAYVLFYCRTEVKLEFPDPPSRSMTASEATEFGRNRARARADSFSTEITTKGDKNGEKGTIAERTDISARQQSWHQQDNTIAHSMMEQREHNTDAQRGKIMILPLGSPHKLLQNVDKGVVRDTKGPARSKKSEGTLSTSSLSNSVVHSLPKIQDNSNASSDDSSYNGSSSDSSASSDTESSNVDSSDRCTDSSSRNEGGVGNSKPASNHVNTSAAKQKNGGKKSSKSERNSEGGSSIEEKKITDSKQIGPARSPKEGLKNSVESSEAEMDSVDASTSGGKTQIPDKKQIESVSSSKQRPSKAAESSESESDNEDISTNNEKKTEDDKLAGLKRPSTQSPRNVDESSESESDSENESSSNDKKKPPASKQVGSDVVSKQNPKYTHESSESESDSENESSSNDKKKPPASKQVGSDVVSKQNPKYTHESSASETDSESESSTNGKKKIAGDREVSGSAETSTKRSPLTKMPDKAKSIVNNTDSRGKVKVMLGPRKRKIWESKASALPSKGTNFQLLGNLKVSQWGDDDDDTNVDGNNSTTFAHKLKESQVHSNRKNIVDRIEKQNRVRKRTMHLDRWDSHLDQGKQKKVKINSGSDLYEATSVDPKKNVFQRIQSSVQRMSRGKPKGNSNTLFRRKFNNKKGRF